MFVKYFLKYVKENENIDNIDLNQFFPKENIQNFLNSYNSHSNNHLIQSIEQHFNISNVPDKFVEECNEYIQYNRSLLMV
jgi:hypothetical protein